MVLAISADSPMVSQGISAGSIIASVAGKSVGTITELQDVIDKTPMEKCSIELANAGDDDVASASAAIEALVRTRTQLVALLDGVDEATFFALRALGREQYSVVSVLENVASHDHEHLEQIAKTLAAAKTTG